MFRVDEGGKDRLSQQREQDVQRLEAPEAGHLGSQEQFHEAAGCPWGLELDRAGGACTVKAFTPRKFTLYPTVNTHTFLHKS